MLRSLLAPLLALYALGARPSAVASAWTIDAPPAAAPDDILGEHQPLARAFTVSSAGCLDALYLAVPGRVFIELDPSLLPPPPTPETEAPVPETEAPAPETEAPAPETEAPAPETEVPLPETEAPAPETEAPTVAPLPVLPVPLPLAGGSGSGSLWNASGSVDAISFPTVQLRRHKAEEDDEWNDEGDESAERCRRRRGRGKKHGKKHSKKHHKDEEGEDAEQVVARVVVTGDSAELLDMLEAVPVNPKRANALKLHLQNADAVADGFLVTTVYVMDARSLRAITTAFDGDVVVDDRVLAILDDREALVAANTTSAAGSDEDEEEEEEEDDDDLVDTRLSLSVVGVGNVIVFRAESSQPTGRVAFGALDLVITGSGSIQLPFLTGAELALTKSLEVDVAGSGAVVLAPDAVSADWVSASVTGSGEVVVESRGAVAIASSLELSVFGSGALSVATSGSVPKEKIELSGSGQLLAGSIQAVNADVSVWGTGQVLVQAIKKLTVSTSVWGTVGYVNARPDSVKIDGWWFWRSADQIVYPAETNTMLPAVFDPLPPKYPTYYAVETTRSRRDADPDYTVVTTEPEEEDDGSDGFVSLAVAQAADATGLGPMTVVALVAVVAAVVAVAARAAAQFRVRRQYTRLI